MNPTDKCSLSALIKKYEVGLISDWIKEQLASGIRHGLIKERELREQCGEFLRLFQEATLQLRSADVSGAEWVPVRELLAAISRSRGAQGFSPSETASFVFALRTPLLTRLGQEFSQNGDVLLTESIIANAILDKLGLFTTEIYQKAREDVINRQQSEMLELSTPVVCLWEGVLALPMIGTLDSARTQVVMETLLQRIVETGSEIAIIDITGVPTVDTLVAQHLLKTVTAARLMGAECIISGIRPQIAATIVHLGVDLGDVITKATLKDAFSLALKKTGRTVSAPTSRF